MKTPRKSSQKDIVRKAFGLSNSEAEIAAVLHERKSLQQIAVARQVSIETLRAQLKAIYWKVGVHRQAELVALVERLAR